MFYLEYEESTRIVSKIHEVEPSEIASGHAIAQSDKYDLGLELEYVITVDTVDHNGKVTASSTTKQVGPAYQLLKKIDELEKENKALKGSVADLWETILVAGGNE